MTPNIDDEPEYAPYSDRVVQLGLILPEEDFRDGAALYRSAMTRLEHWQARREAARRRVTQVLHTGGSGRLRFNASAMLGEAYRAGLRLWLAGVSFVTLRQRFRRMLPSFLRSSCAGEKAAPPNQTPADLRWWCSLQLRAMEEVVPEAYPAPTFCQRRKAHPEPEKVSFHCREVPGGDTLLYDEDFLDEVAWLFPPPEAQEPTDRGRLLRALGSFYCAPSAAAGEEERRPPLDYPSLVHLAWVGMRDLASRLDTPHPAEPASVPDERACRSALDHVRDWCWAQERRPAPDANQAAVEQAPKEGAGKRDRRGREELPAAQSWTQDALDAAIRKYKAERAATYRNLVEAVRSGSRGVRKDAQRLFGRNAVARRLRVKAKAMVSKSPAWQEIAEELQLECKGHRQTGPRARGRVGFDIAAEQAAQARGDIVVNEANRRETIRLIRRRMQPKDAEAVISKLESGQMTDEEARGVAELAE